MSAGKRGPANAVMQRTDRDKIIDDLIAYQFQQVTGAADGEDKITLRSIADKYRISIRSLQQAHYEVQDRIRTIRKASELCGVTQFDIVRKTIDMYDRAIDLHERVRTIARRTNEYKDVAMEKEILQSLFPIALDRLTVLAMPVDPPPKVGDAKDGNGLPSINVSIINGIQARQQAAPEHAGVMLAARVDDE